MVAATPLRYKPKARQPFIVQIAREFGLTKGHVARVLDGERVSPRFSAMRARQQELLAAATVTNGTNTTEGAV